MTIRTDLRGAAGEALEVLELSDPEGHRADRIHAPEDHEIYQLCERLGYGAVMDSAARQWRRKDPIGAHTTGACVLTVQQAVEGLRVALGASNKKTAKRRTSTSDKRGKAIGR